MPVTEIALLQYPCRPVPGRPGEFFTFTTDLLLVLDDAARAQASFSGYPVTLLNGLEDQWDIYLIGGWDSISHHMDKWIPSEINQKLLETLGKHGVEVKWMFHLDCEPKDLLHGCINPTYMQEGVVSISRHIMKKDQRQQFQDFWDANTGPLDRHMGGKDKRREGWRLDHGYEAGKGNIEEQKGMFGSAGGEEFVSFSAWQNLERSDSFVETKGFEKSSDFGQFLKGFWVRHGRVIDNVDP